MGSDSAPPGPASSLTVTVAQVALLVRILVLFFIAVVSLVQGRGLVTVLVMLVAIPGYLALRSRRLRAFVSRHPLVVLLDVVALMFAVAVVGADTPFVLALGTSALLVGLWLPLVPGLMVMAVVLAVHLTLLTARPIDDAGVTAFVLLVPPVLMTLWSLGLAIQRSGRAEALAQASLRDAISAAATSQERARIAREMHDTIAKSLQAMAFTASSLPVHLRRDPEVGLARARELEFGCTEVIAQVRGLMSELRTPVAAVPFSDAVDQVLEEWRSSTGRRCVAELEHVDVTDDLVRYELLMGLGEALDNVRRHAGRCTTRVRLTVVEDRVVLVIADDGVGSDPEHVAGSGARGHFGVVGMRERMDQIGGDFDHRTEPGRGTTVTFSVHRRGLVEKRQEVMT